MQGLAIGNLAPFEIEIKPSSIVGNTPLEDIEIKIKIKSRINPNYIK